MDNIRATAAGDDRLTLAAIGILAYMVANVLHECVGHGGTALLLGAQHVVFSTVALDSSLDSKWIDAAGTLMNLAAAIPLWLVLKTAKLRSSHTYYFLLLTFAFNLFTGTGYFLFSGILGIGDWAGVIQGLPYPWLWRTLMTVVGAVSYYASMRLFAGLLQPFLGSAEEPARRCRRLCITPYVAVGVLATLGGLLNPAGIELLFISALPSTLGANFGLLRMGRFVRPKTAEAARGPIERSVGWIAAAVVLGLVYVLVVGRGVTLRG